MSPTRFGNENQIMHILTPTFLSHIPLGISLRLSGISQSNQKQLNGYCSGLALLFYYIKRMNTFLFIPGHIFPKLSIWNCLKDGNAIKKVRRLAIQLASDGIPGIQDLIFNFK